DNAVAESFFKTLKAEIIYGATLLAPEKLRNQLFIWIECWYNKNRRHAALNNLTIIEFSGKQNKKNKLTNFPNLLCG
ncbi:MAG: integrase core domain-containing protein, partial [Alistipes sp.]